MAIWHSHNGAVYKSCSRKNPGDHHPASVGKFKKWQLDQAECKMKSSMALQVFSDTLYAFTNTIADDKKEKSTPTQIHRYRIREVGFIYGETRFSQYFD